MIDIGFQGRDHIWNVSLILSSLKNGQIEGSGKSENFLLTFFNDIVITFVLFSQVIDNVGWLILDEVSGHFLSIFFNELSPQFLLCDECIISLVKNHLGNDEASVPRMCEICDKAEVFTCE